MYKVNRNFSTLHGTKLAVFAERVFRKSQASPYLVCPRELIDALNRALLGLQNTLQDLSLKRKRRTQAIRESELPVLALLVQLADYVEQNAKLKSDINTTGFRPATLQRKRVDAAAAVY